MKIKYFSKQKMIILLFFLIFFGKSALSNCPNITDIKVADSFGVQFCAMPKVDDKYLIHAKKVMDELIDYNNDGAVENQKVIDQIIKSRSVFAIFRSEREVNKFENAFYPEEVTGEMQKDNKTKRTGFR